MAAGDAHRVWLAEMVEPRRLRWQDDPYPEALLGLRYELDDMVARIRSTRHISHPVINVPCAGAYDVAPFLPGDDNLALAPDHLDQLRFTNTA